MKGVIPKTRFVKCAVAER